MQELLNDINAEYERYGETQYSDDYHTIEPATDEELDELEAAVGHELPEAFRNYQKLNTVRHSFAGSFDSLQPEQILSRWESMTSAVDDGAFDGWVERRDFGNWKSGKIERVWWSPNWIPVAADSCGNLMCIDFGPGPNGKVGQIVNMENQDGQGPYATDWTSFSNYLEMHLQYLREGRAEIYSGQLSVDPYSAPNPEYAQ